MHCSLWYFNRILEDYWYLLGYCTHCLLRDLIFFLDGNNEIIEEYYPLVKKSEALDFDSLLQQARKQAEEKKKKTVWQKHLLCTLNFKTKSFKFI